LFNSDEELGSVDSAELVKELSAEARAVVVFEYTHNEAEIKIGSRGYQLYNLTIKGEGGHSAYPELLANPIFALNDVLAELHRLNNEETGMTVVPTVVSTVAIGTMSSPTWSKFL
jgi:glutamate carboxypeptidase